MSTDIFATLLALLDLKHPDPGRPLDGLDLTPLIVDGSMKERPAPIGFWSYDRRSESENPRWMAPSLTRGTTPTVRNPGIDFVNFRHPVARTSDFGGMAAWMENRYKLIRFGEQEPELYDLISDPQELSDVASKQPNRVRSMLERLEEWQRSVERSLSGRDYRGP